MRPPRPVLVPAAVGGHLPRHRRDRLAQPGRDRGERLPGMQAQGDLLPVGQRQPPRPGHPAIAADRPPRSMAHDQRHPLMRAAHLRADLPQRQAPGPQPQRQLPLLHRQMRTHPQPPQLIENPLDSPRPCADCLNPPTDSLRDLLQLLYGFKGAPSARRGLTALWPRAARTGASSREERAARVTRRRRPGFTRGSRRCGAAAVAASFGRGPCGRGGCRARHPGDRPRAVPAASRCRARLHHGQAVTVALSATRATRMSQPPGRSGSCSRSTNSQAVLTGPEVIRAAASSGSIVGAH